MLKEGNISPVLLIQHLRSQVESFAVLQKVARSGLMQMSSLNQAGTYKREWGIKGQYMQKLSTYFCDSQSQRCEILTFQEGLLEEQIDVISFFCYS